MQHRSHPLRLRFALLPAAAAVALALAGCGGGGGGGPVSSATPASFSGAAIDAPIAGATITFTAGAPLADGGQSIGNITANSQGGFTVTVNLPSGTGVPIFANAAAPAGAGTTPLELASYLGQSDALAAVGALTTSNLPDLDISPVTTAALAVYAATNNNSFAALTPAAYALTLSTYRNDILAIAAAVKAVGDNLCTPAQPIGSTSDLALQIAQNAKLSSTNTASTTLATAAAYLGGSCSALPALQMAILADSRFAPELDLGDLIEANVQAVVPGSYQLQSVIAETTVLQTINTVAGSTPGGTTTSTANPAEVFVDDTIQVDASGNVTSGDNKVSGRLYGNLLSLQVKDGNGNVYQLRAKVGSLPTALSSGQQTYGVQGGGINTANQALTLFNADLVPVAAGGAAAAPSWNAYWTASGAPTGMGSEDSGIKGCATGQLALRFDLNTVFPQGTHFDDALGSLAECVAPTAGSASTSWTMVTAASTYNQFNEDHDGWVFNMQGASLGQAGQPSGTVVWSEATTPTAAPYVMQADNVTLTPPTITTNSATTAGTAITGSAYYVLGSRSVVLSPASASTSQGNAILNIQGNLLSQLSESSRNSQQGDQPSQGDH